MLYLSKLFGISSILFFLQFTAFSQSPELRLNEIMAGNDFIGHQPSDFEWSPDGEHIYFKWQREGDLIPYYYAYSVQSEESKKIEFTGDNIVPVNGFEHDNESTFFQLGQSIYQIQKNQTKKIYTHTANYQIQQVIGNTIIIKQNNNFFRFSITEGSFEQITNFLPGEKPTSEDSKTYLEKQELELFNTLQKKAAKVEAQKVYRKIMQPYFISPFYLEGWRLDQANISAHQNTLAFTRSKYPKDKTTDFINYISTDGYARTEKARSKVGGQNPSHQLFIWQLDKDTVVPVNFNNLTDLHRIPEFYQTYPGKQPKDYTKDLIFHLHGFNEDGSKCLVEIKSYDNKDRWIGTVDSKTGTFTEHNHQHDEKWIGGPGITGWNMVSGNVDWVTNKQFYFQSEESGYSHLYLFDIQTGTSKALTSGKFEIHEAKLSRDKSTFYISANKRHPGNREFYHLDIKTKEWTPILTKDGNHEVKVSPDEKWLLVNYSYKNKPWELYIAPNKANTRLKQVTQSTRTEFNAYNWREPEVITFNAKDGQDVYARLYEPDPTNKNGAAIFFVHGAGYLQNAHNWWSRYYREYMFHNLLCDMGFTVMDVDYRASKGYGRDFRTAIYRHMGGKDLSDYLDAADYLVQNHGIDSNRIGIYGGSYGGFITIMALLTEPGRFECGAAIRSVTDWSHYNHPYTSNILNTPEEDPLAFKQSSPIYFAENLSDRLLMLHGMVDDNVQYQDVVRLSQRFIELGKKDWDLVGYPIEPHGFKETSSWVDEYGRILKLFKEELLTP